MESSFYACVRLLGRYRLIRPTITFCSRPKNTKDLFHGPFLSSSVAYNKSFMEAAGRKSGKKYRRMISQTKFIPSVSEPYIDWLHGQGRT